MPQLSAMYPRRSTLSRPWRKLWSLFKYCRNKSSSLRDGVLFEKHVMLERSTRPTSNSTSEGSVDWSNFPSPGTFQFHDFAELVLLTLESVQFPSTSA